MSEPDPMMALLQQLLSNQDKANAHLVHIDKKLDRIDRRLDRLESASDRLDERMDSIDTSVRHSLELLAANAGDLAQHVGDNRRHAA